MARQSISLLEWRQLPDAEQRAAIRAGFVAFEDLPEDLRSEVEEMLATSRPVPSKA